VKVGVELLDVKSITYSNPAKNGAPPNPYVVCRRKSGEEVFRSGAKTAATHAFFNEFLGQCDVTSPEETWEIQIMHEPRGRSAGWLSHSGSTDTGELIGSTPLVVGRKVWNSRNGDHATIELFAKPSRDQHGLQGGARNVGTIRIKLSTVEVKHRGVSANDIAGQGMLSVIDPCQHIPVEPHIMSQSPQMRMRAVMHVKEVIRMAESRGHSALQLFIEKDQSRDGTVSEDVFHSVIGTLLHMGGVASTSLRSKSAFDGVHAELQLVKEECRLASGLIDYRLFTAMLASSNVQELLRAPGMTRPALPSSQNVALITEGNFRQTAPRIGDVGGNASDLSWLQGPNTLPRLWHDFEQSDLNGLGHTSRAIFTQIVHNVTRTLGRKGDIPANVLHSLTRRYAPSNSEAVAKYGQDCVNYETMLTEIESGSATDDSRTRGTMHARGAHDGMVREALEKTRKWAIRSFSGKDELKATILVNSTRFRDTFSGGGNATDSSFITRVVPRALFRRRLTSLGLELSGNEWLSVINTFSADGTGSVGVNIDSFISALNLDGAYIGEGGGWQSSKQFGTSIGGRGGGGGVRALRWRVLEAIFMRGVDGLEKVKDVLQHEDKHGRGRGDMLRNDGIIGRPSFRRAIRRIVQGRVSRYAADELADDPRWRTGMNGVEEAGVDFRRFLSLIADLDERDVADLRRRVLAAAAAGHLPAALNGGTVAIEHMSQYCLARGDNYINQRDLSKALDSLHFPFSDAEIAALCLRWRKPGSDETHHHEHSADIGIEDRERTNRTPRSTRHGGRRIVRGSKGVDVLYTPLLQAICGAEKDSLSWKNRQHHASSRRGGALSSRVAAVHTDSDTGDDDDDDEIGGNGAFELTRKLAAKDFYDQMYGKSSTSRHSRRKGRTYSGHSSLVSAGTPRHSGSQTSRHRNDRHVTTHHRSRSSRSFNGPPASRSRGATPTSTRHSSRAFGRSSPRRTMTSSPRASSRSFADSRTSSRRF
jgi:hypothetical protein